MQEPAFRHAGYHIASRNDVGQVGSYGQHPSHGHPVGFCNFRPSGKLGQSHFGTDLRRTPLGSADFNALRLDRTG
jgi:hypothetical protein